MPALQRASLRRLRHHHMRSVRFWQLWSCILHRSRGSRERAQPVMTAEPGGLRPDTPLMDPLNVTHGMLRCWRAGVWGGHGAGAPPRFRR